MRVVFRPEAKAEAIEARDWYESRAPGLGIEFVEALEVALTAAMRNPEAFAAIESDLRRVILPKFPYSLVFRPEADRIVVFAVFHHRRAPLPWSRK
jgi:plasmid stabilization system protein ParE